MTNLVSSIQANSPTKPAIASHSSASSLREQALSHLLIWRLIAARWRQGLHDKGLAIVLVLISLATSPPDGACGNDHRRYFPRAS